MKKKFLAVVMILALFIFSNSLVFAHVSKEKEERIRVVLIPEKQKNVKFKMFKASFLSKIKFIRKFKFKNGIVALIPKSKIKELEKQGFKVYIDYKLRAFLTESVPLINADKVWKIVFNSTNITGKSVSVCVIDTGVDYTHPDLGNCTKEEFLSGNCEKVIAGYNFVNTSSDPMDDNGHGTHVAGIIAANGTLKGVAPDAKIVAVKALNENGIGDASDIIDGIWWCTNHSKEYNISVISLSLGTENLYATYCDKNFPLFSEVINASVSKGIAVVVATGNEGNYSGIAAPACIYNAIRVGATYKRNYTGNVSWCLDQLCSRKCVDSNPKIDNITCFTNRGGEFDVILMTPGVDINSTLPGGYDEWSGTSMATPHVSGAIALIRQVNKNLSPKEIENLFNKTAKQIYDPATKKHYPRIDVYKAVSKLIAPQLFSPKVFPLFGNASTVFNFTVNYTHAANVSPAYVKVCIDSNCFNAITNCSNFASGCIFTFSTNLSYGVHKFYFEAFDGEHEVNTSTINFPWVADKFWLSEEEKISAKENLTGKYIITNSSLLNVTGTLILEDSFVKNTKNLSIATYGNLSLINTTFFETKPVLKIYIVNKANLTWNFSQGKITSLKNNITVSNTSFESVFITIEKTSVNIFNSSIATLELLNASVFAENSFIKLLNLLENSSLKGYVKIKNVAFSQGKFFNRSFPVKLVKDINGTIVERNITLWKNRSLANFTTRNGFAWVSALFSEKNESYYLVVENYGFARINGKNLLLCANFDSMGNITLDVVFPSANVSVSEIFISPLSSHGVKDNTTIKLNSSEPLKQECIFINTSSETVYQACGNVFTWNASSMEDGVYSLWINLTDFWENRNITKVGEITVDNTLPEISLSMIPKVVINSSKINITAYVLEQNLNFSLINITSANESFSRIFYNFTTFIFIPNYTTNYTISALSLDKAGNKKEVLYSLISRPKIEVNLTIKTKAPLQLSFIYENSLVNQTNLTQSSKLYLPDWIYNVSIISNNSELELLNVNTTENKNMSLRVEQAFVRGFLKAYAFEVNANFSISIVRINYSDTDYTNEDYLALYVCDIWNFSENKCHSSWKKTNFTINKTLKIIETNTTHFSAFAVKQEPYCGDGIVNQPSEECDTNDFGGKTCESFGYDYGTLICTANCEISLSNCRFSSSTSKTSSFTTYFYFQKTKKNETKKIVNISLLCPENLTFSSKNVSFEILVLNSGNASTIAKVIVEHLNISAEINLLVGENKTLAFNTFLGDGIHEIVVSTQNSSCKFFISVSLPKIYHTLKERVEALKILSKELNLSSKELEKADTLLEAEKYEQAKIFVKAFEEKIQERLEEVSQMKKSEKKKLKEKYLQEIYMRVTILVMFYVFSVVAIYFLEKRFNIFSRR